MNEHSTNLRVRPRFRMELALSPDEIKQRLRSALTSNPSNCIGEFVSNHVTLKIPSAQQRVWSPQLQLELEDIPTGTLLRGLISPKPGIWTMFVFFYSGFGFLTMLGGLFGISQMMLKMDPWALWSLPAGIGIIVILYFISHIGQRLSRDQIDFLHGFLNSALNQN